MSQYIKKLNTGGTADTLTQEPIKLFTTAVGLYDANLLAKNFENNLGAYIEHLGLKYGSKDYNKFIEEATKIEKGIKEGTFLRGEGRVYRGLIIGNNNRAQSWALGLLDKVIDKSSVYNPEQPEQPVSEKPAEKFNPNYLKTYFFNKEFGGLSNPDLSDWQLLDELGEDGVRSTTNRAKIFSNILLSYANKVSKLNIDFTDSPFEDNVEYQTKLRSAANLLETEGWSTKTKQALNQIGIGSKLQNNLFGTKIPKEEKPDDDTPHVDPSGDTTGGGNLSDEVAPPATTLSGYDQFQNFANSHWKGNLGKTSQEYYTLYRGKDVDTIKDLTGKFVSTSKENKEEFEKLGASLFNKLITRKLTKNDLDKEYTKYSEDGTPIYGKDVLYYYLNKRINNTNLFEPKGTSGYYYILNSLSLNNGSILRYDNLKGKVEIEYYTPDNNILGVLMKRKYQEKYGIDPDNRSVAGKTEWKKLGGKLKELRKLRTGGSPDDPPEDIDTIDNSVNDIDTLSYDEFSDEFSDATQTIENSYNEKVDNELKVRNDAISPKLTLEKRQQLDSNYNEAVQEDPSIAAANRWRIAALKFNGIAAASAFVPGYGSVVSLGSGLLGLITEGVGDYIDWQNGRMSNEEFIGNTVCNAGLTAAAAFGFGALKSAKISQAAKNWIGKTFHYGFFGAGIGSFFANGGISELYNLTTKPSDLMTVEDKKNLNRLWYLLFGIVGMAGATKLRFKKMPSDISQFKPIEQLDVNETYIIDNGNTEYTVTGTLLLAMKDAAANKILQSKGNVTAETLNQIVGEAWLNNHPDKQNLTRHIENGDFDPSKIFNATQTDDGLDLNIKFGDTESSVHFTKQLQVELENLRKQILDEKYDGKSADDLDPYEIKEYTKEFIKLARQRFPSLLTQTTTVNSRDISTPRTFREDVYGGANGKIKRSFDQHNLRKLFENSTEYSQRKANEQIDEVVTYNGGNGVKVNNFDLTTPLGIRNTLVVSKLNTPQKRAIFNQMTNTHIDANDVRTAQITVMDHPDLFEGVLIVDPVQLRMYVKDAYINFFKEAKVDLLNADLVDELCKLAYKADVSHERRTADRLYDLLEPYRQNSNTRQQNVSFDLIKSDLLQKIDIKNARIKAEKEEQERIKKEKWENRIKSVLNKYKDVKESVLNKYKRIHDWYTAIGELPDGTKPAEGGDIRETPTDTPESIDGTITTNNSNDTATPEWTNYAEQETPGSNSSSLTETATVTENNPVPQLNNKEKIQNILQQINEKLNNKKIKKAKIKKKILKITDNPNISSTEKIKYLENILNSFRNGGIINKLIYLRGGIIKADGGTKVETSNKYLWYYDRYPLLSMLDAEELKNHNSYLDKSITDNNHNLAFDLSVAAQKNFDYISNHDIVGDDINSFYDTDGQNKSLTDFVKYYNELMLKLRDTWGQMQDGSKKNTEWHLNQKDVALEHNRLFRKLYKNRSLASAGPSYNIGYLEGVKNGVNVEAMMGSSTWMRRPDLWEFEFEKDPDPLKRIFKVKDLGYVYKKANGDIAILPDEKVKALLELKPEEEKNPKTKEVEVTYYEVYGLNTGAGRRPKDGFKSFTKDVLKGVSDRKPDLMALGRLVSNLRNNRKVTNLMLQTRPTLKSPIDLHSYVRTGFTALLSAYNTASLQQNLQSRAVTSDANANNARALLAAYLANTDRLRADLASNGVMYRTAEEAENLDRLVYSTNHTVLDFNEAALANQYNNRLSMKAQLRSGNLNNFNIWSQELEKRMRDAVEDEKAKREELEENYDLYQEILALQNDPTYQKLQAKYKEAVETGSKDLEALATAMYNYRIQFKLDYKQKKLEQEALKYKADIEKRKKDIDIRVETKKRGGDIDDTRVKKRQKDNELIVKQIMFLIKTNEKALDRLSRAQLLSIQKMLS